MATYTLTPNERIICSSVTPNLLIKFDCKHLKYQPEPLYIHTYWEPFVDEVQFKKGFNALLSEHKLIDYHDDLLYLVLTNFDQMWLRISKHCALHEAKSRVEELSKITNILVEKHGKLQSLSLNTLTEFEEVNDNILKKWMQMILVDAIANQNYPNWAFKEGLMFQLPTEEYVVTESITNLSSLQAAKDLILITNQTYIRRQHVDFCRKICRYLNTITPLRTKKGALFSNAQLRFFFDLLVLLKQIHPLKKKELKSLPESYMRTFLTNVVKRNKHSCK